MIDIKVCHCGNNKFVFIEENGYDPGGKEYDCLYVRCSKCFEKPMWAKEGVKV